MTFFLSNNRWKLVSAFLIISAAIGSALILFWPWNASEISRTQDRLFAKTAPLKKFLKVAPILSEKWRAEVAWELTLGKQQQFTIQQLNKVLPAFTEDLRERGLLSNPTKFETEFRRRHELALTAVQTNNGSGPRSIYEIAYLSPTNRSLSYSPQSDYFQEKDLSGLNMRPILRAAARMQSQLANEVLVLATAVVIQRKNSNAESFWKTWEVQTENKTVRLISWADVLEASGHAKAVYDLDSNFVALAKQHSLSSATKELLEAAFHKELSENTRSLKGNQSKLAEVTTHIQSTIEPTSDAAKVLMQDSTRIYKGGRKSGEINQANKYDPWALEPRIEINEIDINRLQTEREGLKNKAKLTTQEKQRLEAIDNELQKKERRRNSLNTARKVSVGVSHAQSGMKAAGKLANLLHKSGFLDDKTKQDFDKAANVVGTALNFAQAAATGDVFECVSIGIDVIGGLFGIEPAPSPEEVRHEEIMGALNALQEGQQKIAASIAKLRQEMHTEFEEVHKELREIRQIVRDNQTLIRGQQKSPLILGQLALRGEKRYSGYKGIVNNHFDEHAENIRDALKFLELHLPQPDGATQLEQNTKEYRKLLLGADEVGKKMGLTELSDFMNKYIDAKYHQAIRGALVHPAKTFDELDRQLDDLLDNESNPNKVAWEHIAKRHRIEQALRHYYDPQMVSDITRLSVGLHPYWLMLKSRRTHTMYSFGDLKSDTVQPFARLGSTHKSRLEHLTAQLRRTKTLVLQSTAQNAILSGDVLLPVIALGLPSSHIDGMSNTSHARLPRPVRIERGQPNYGVVFRKLRDKARQLLLKNPILRENALKYHIRMAHCLEGLPTKEAKEKQLAKHQERFLQLLKSDLRKPIGRLLPKLTFQQHGTKYKENTLPGIQSLRYDELVSQSLHAWRNLKKQEKLRQNEYVQAEKQFDKALLRLYDLPQLRRAKPLMQVFFKKFTPAKKKQLASKVLGAEEKAKTRTERAIMRDVRSSLNTYDLAARRRLNARHIFHSYVPRYFHSRYDLPVHGPDVWGTPNAHRTQPEIVDGLLFVRFSSKIVVPLPTPQQLKQARLRLPSYLPILEQNRTKLYDYYFDLMMTYLPEDHQSKANKQFNRERLLRKLASLVANKSDETE